MKYIFIILITAAIVFAASLVYFKGLPKVAVSPTPIPTGVSQISPSSPPAPIPTINENDALTASVKAGLIAEHGQDASAMTITVSKIEGDYAKGMANEQGGGGIWFAAKVSGEWKLVWDGNGIILCTDLTSYPNFPKDLIPSCYDNSSQKLINR